MKIHLRTNTGQGITIQGSVDTSELPRPLVKKIEESLIAKRFATAQAAPVNPNMVDGQQYEISFVTEAGQSESFSLSDSGCPDDILDLLDDLTHEIILKKKGLK